MIVPLMMYVLFVLCLIVPLMMYVLFVLCDCSVNDARSRCVVFHCYVGDGRLFVMWLIVY